MTAFRPAFALLALAGCAPDWVEPDASSLDPLERVSCDPLMNTFPVAAPHNIGYDHSSCGTGTCDISCPDVNANSDWGGSHHGIDVFAYQGAPLVAVVDAEVVAVGTVSSTSGLRVRLRDACGWEYYYGHMDTEMVSVGQWVSAGQQIGTMGYTGTQSTHLHFNVSPDGAYSSDINPIDLLVSTSATACGGVPDDHDDCPEDDPPVTNPDPQPDPDPIEGCGVVAGTTVFDPYDALWSCNGQYQLSMQGDGNLVLYSGSTPLWHTYTNGQNGNWAAFQDDGNFVLYNAWGTPIWSSETHGNPGSVLAVQDDGNLVIYNGVGWPIWSTGTH